MNSASVADPTAFTRANYLKTLSGYALKAAVASPRLLHLHADRDIPRDPQLPRIHRRARPAPAARPSTARPPLPTPESPAMPGFQPHAAAIASAFAFAFSIAAFKAWERASVSSFNVNCRLSIRSPPPASPCRSPSR